MRGERLPQPADQRAQLLQRRLVAGACGGYGDNRVGQGAEDGLEQAGLGAEVVEDQLLVDARCARDAVYAGTRETVAPKLSVCGCKDEMAGVPVGGQGLNRLVDTRQ